MNFGQTREEMRRVYLNCTNLTTAIHGDVDTINHALLLDVSHHGPSFVETRTSLPGPN